MTTFFTKTVTCQVCGQTGEQRLLGSTNRSGYQDLDFRPPEMERSTLSFWLQQCGGCGYAAADLSRPNEGVREIVGSEGYRGELGHAERVPLANRFLACAYLSEAQGKLADAGWRTLHAAWACDDARHPAAQECRRRAAERFQRAAAAGQSFCTDQKSEALLLIDLLRRAGEWEAALALCRPGRGEKWEGVPHSVLAFQRSLIRERDGRCYTVGDAVDGTRSEGEDE